MVILPALLYGSNMIDITGNRQMIQCIFVGTILRSEDCQPEQQSAHHNDHRRFHDQQL